MKPLDQFTVSLAPGRPAALLATLDDPGQAAASLLQELNPARAYVGTLAVKDRPCRIQDGDGTGSVRQVYNLLANGKWTLR